MKKTNIPLIIAIIVLVVFFLVIGPEEARYKFFLGAISAGILAPLNIFINKAIPAKKKAKENTTSSINDKNANKPRIGNQAIIPLEYQVAKPTEPLVEEKNNSKAVSANALKKHDEINGSEKVKNKVHRTIKVELVTKKYCRFCGTKAETGFLFCNQCGKPL